MCYDTSNFNSESEILYFVCPMNLQWPRILKEVKADPKAFYEMGGWEAVLGENDEEGDGEEEEQESDFAPEEESSGGEEESEDFEEDDEDGEEEYDEEEVDEEEDDDGPTWEELENQARACMYFICFHSVIVSS
jgi:nucleosome binding factor SPN SPT16 subunit